MKNLFDKVSFECSKQVTVSYSTSFSMAVKMLSKDIQDDIHAIYGFVRFADEIVDTFHDFEKEILLKEFENELKLSLERKISLNPILNSFQFVVNKYGIEYELIDAFMNSMKADLYKQEYSTTEEINEYIYGSADVVGLMCLKVFVDGNNDDSNIKTFQSLTLPNDCRYILGSADGSGGFGGTNHSVITGDFIVGNDGVGDVRGAFFEIGGDSIQSIQVIAKARKIGIKLAPNQLFEYQTIAELATFLEKQKASSKAETKENANWSSLVSLNKKGSKPPLFCIHSGGGHVFFYRPLAKHLPLDQPLYALQPKGLDGKETLILGLCFPVIYAIFEFVKTKNFSKIAILGFLSLALTGGFGLAELDRFWFAVFYLRCGRA